MPLRRALAVLASICACFLLVPALAGAQTARSAATASPLTKIAMTGMARNHRHFTGHYTVDRFITRGGRLFAVGTLTGKLGSRSVRVTDLKVPASLPKAGGLASSAAVCPILHLTLGPLNLNLLGLTVHLNRVVLNINAVSGPGNLLGNLLCTVANLLNPGVLPVQQVAGLLNILQQLINTPALLNL